MDTILFNKQLLDLIQAIVLMLDNNGKIILINKFGCELLETTSEKLVDVAWTQLVEPATAEGFLYSNNADEGWISTHHGKKSRIGWKDQQIFDDTGNIIGVLRTGVNITNEYNEKLRFLHKEARLLTLNAHAPTVICELNDECIILYHNGSDEKDAIIPLSIGMDFKNVFPNHLREGFSQAVKETLAGNITRKFDAKIVSLNDQNKWVTIRMSPIDDTSVILILSDISEQKQIQEALRDSVEKYRVLTDTIRDFILVTDLNGYIDFANEAVETIYGYNRDFFIHKKFTEFVVPEHKYKLNAEFQKRNEGFTDQMRYNVEIITKSGNRIMIELSSKVLLHSNQQVMIMFVGSNISEQKAYEKMLQLEIAINNAIANLSQELLSPKLSLERMSRLVIEYANKLIGAAEARIFIIPNSLVEKFLLKDTNNPSYFKLDEYDVFPNQLTLNPQIWKQPINPKIGFIVNDDCQDNDMKDIVSHLNPFKSFLSVPAKAGFNLIGQLSFAQSEHYFSEEDLKIAARLANLFAVAVIRKTIENDMLKAKMKAEESDRLKLAFLSNMSHEIRTPMNGIIGFANLLNQPNLEENDKKEFIKIINSNGRSLLTLIEDIIDISRIEAGQLKIKYQDVDINEMLTELEAQFKEQLDANRENKVSLLIVLPDHPLNQHLITDGNRIRQIIVNLIGNAIKFTEKGDIKIGYTYSENEITFFVKDTGIGIPEDKLEIIFDRFRQVDDGRTKRFGGTGLGLTISKHLVNLLGGNLWCNSEAEKGSNFYFSLPLKVSYKQTILHNYMDKSNYNWESKRVLIVEDEEVNYLYLTHIISKTGAICLRSSNGKEAVEKVSEENNIDIVLMDIKMPVMNGLEATKAIREFNKILPIIAQTAYAMEDEKQKCFDAGCNDYIPKPINKNLLFMMMDEFLTKG